MRIRTSRVGATKDKGLDKQTNKKRWPKRFFLERLL